MYVICAIKHNTKFIHVGVNSVPVSTRTKGSFSVIMS